MKKGFTLIELLAVIVILAIIALIATPIILGVVENARKSAAGSSALGYLDAVEKAIALDGLDNIVYPTGDIDILTAEHYKDIEVQGEAPSKGSLVVSDRYLITSAVLCVNNYKVELTGHKINKITKDGCGDMRKPYEEEALNGAYPVLKGNLIPVTIDETTGEVTQADIYDEWYKYADKRWANAVILTDEGEIEEDGSIKEDAIESYFVWIPKYRYQLWDLGNYSSNTGTATSDNTRTIKIEFNTEDTKNITGKECIATNKSGDVGECNVDEWMTHPAFTSFGVDGFWVAKFETTGNIDAVSVKPNNSPIIKFDNKTYFEVSYKYDRTLDSHMIKNTEWGAIAYLSHSKYGIGGEVGINSYYNENHMTGCGSAPGSALMITCNSYNTADGMKASTTGNITGVYDMSGGAWDRIAAYHQGYYSETGFDEATISQYNEKYFDVYKSTSSSDFTGRILGDATGEMGPFKDELNSWYGDQATFVNGFWFIRGGHADLNNKAGIFAFDDTDGANSHEDAFRLVLSPK